MTEDPLYQPLGTRSPQLHRRRGGPRVLIAAMAVVAIGIVGAALFLAPVPPNRNSVAIAPIEPAKAVVPPVAPAPAIQAAPAPAVGPSNITVNANGDTVEVQNGVKIIRMGGARSAGAMSVPVLDPSSVALSPAPDRALIEKSAFGDLPRVGPNGTRPADAYARPIAPASSGPVGAPRIAILVGGLGLDRTLTDAAIAQFPAAVSLAFQPDATDLPTEAAQARAAGHETLLDLQSGEPVRREAGNSRPTVETAALDPLPDLHKQMGRFTGYVGLVGQLGSSLLRGPEAARLVLADVAARGLLFVDAMTAAPDSRVTPADLELARVDVVIDGRLARDSVNAALAQLESVARSNGHALGYVETLSGNADVVTRFAAGLQARGIELIPVSALARGGAAIAAQRGR